MTDVTAKVTVRPPARFAYLFQSHLTPDALQKFPPPVLRIMARISRPHNLPGWFLLIIGTLMVLRQIIAFIDVKPVMEEFNIRDENSVRFMGRSFQKSLLVLQCCEVAQKLILGLFAAFSMGLIGLYNIIGALEDNWNIYWFSLVSRIVGSIIMYTLKGGWENLAHIELGTAVLLAACMWWT